MSDRTFWVITVSLLGCTCGLGLVLAIVQAELTASCEAMCGPYRVERCDAELVVCAAPDGSVRAVKLK